MKMRSDVYACGKLYFDIYIVKNKQKNVEFESNTNA